MCPNPARTQIVESFLLWQRHCYDRRILTRVFGKAAPKIKRAMRIATAKSMKGLRRLSRRMSSSSSKIQTEKDGAAQHDDEKMLDGAGFDDEDPLEAAFKILDREQNLTKEARRACTRSARAAAEAPALKRLSLASLWSTRLDQLGILLIVLCWAITAWVIFAYGVLLYDNVGPGAEVDYMESWWQSFSLQHCEQLSHEQGQRTWVSALPRLQAMR